MCKTKVDGEERHLRTHKAVANIYKCAFYALMVLIGWSILKDSYVMPRALGGDGSLYNLMRDFPYATYPSIYKFYFTSNMGFHISQLLTHIASPPLMVHNDYIEMMLHNLVSTYLFAYCYISNTINHGLIVSYLFSLTDLFICWTRVWAESEFKRVAFVSFLLLQFVWIYTRTLFFPYFIWVSCVQLEVYTISPYVQPTFGFLMSLLFVLNSYWLVGSWKILINYMATNETDDLLQKVGGNTPSTNH